MQFARFGARLAAILLALLIALPALAQSIPGITPSAATPAEAPVDEAVETPSLTPQAAAAALIGILSDETARAALVGELQGIASGASPAGDAAATDAGAIEAEAAASEEESFPSVVSRYTLSVAQHVSAFLGTTMTSLQGFRGLFDGSIQISWDRVEEIAIGLLSVIAVAFGVLYALRALARLLEPPLVRFALRGGWIRRFAATVGYGVVGWLIILASGSAGYAVALAIGDGGRMNLLQSLFLNAFVLIETVKLLLRTMLSPGQPALRIVSMSNESAAYWVFWLARLIGFLGYGVMLFVPLVNMTVSFAVGRAVRVLIVLAAAVFAIVLTLRNRTRVRDGLSAVGKARTGTVRAFFLALSSIWHIAAIGYVLIAFALWSTRPFDAVGFMVSATLLTVLAVSLGLGLLSFVNRRLRAGIRLPAQMRDSLPRLEERLNMFTPVIIGVLRIVMITGIVAVVLHAWSLIDLVAWSESEGGSAVLGSLATAGTVALFAVAVWIIATSWIEVWLNPHQQRVPTPRMRTLLSLFRNALTVVLAVVALMLILSELGLDIAPLLASAGVLGLAIGFGSQKLVEDIITGAFIQFENAMNEGEWVQIGAVVGAVERLTIRSVTLRDGAGVLHVIPFSSVSQVSALNRGFSYFTVEWPVDYDSDIAEVKRLMYVAFERVRESEFGPNIIDVLDMQGIVELRETGIIIRARLKTLAGQQWGTGRHYLEVLKALFDENGISAAPARRTVFVSNEGDGAHHATPLPAPTA